MIRKPLLAALGALALTVPAIAASYYDSSGTILMGVAVPPGVQGSGWNDKILAALGSTPAQVKASAGLLGPTHCDNGNAATVYVEYFNTATPTLGTLSQIISFVPVQSGGGGVAMPIGVNGFTSDIYAVAVTAFNGTTTVGTPLNCNVYYN